MDELKLALIYGSAREGRLCDAIANWVMEQLRVDGTFDVSAVDPRLAYADLSGNALGKGALDSIRRTIAEADAFLVITPEYNHSYPAALKLVIDSVYEAWQAKPVAFVSYGGVSGGIRAVEHLRQVFAELHAVGIRDGVSFANAWETFGGNGDPGQRAEHSFSVLLKRLKWWTRALQHARVLDPYERAA